MLLFNGTISFLWYIDAFHSFLVLESHGNWTGQITSVLHETTLRFWVMLDVMITKLKAKYHLWKTKSPIVWSYLERSTSPKMYPCNLTEAHHNHASALKYKNQSYLILKNIAAWLRGRYVSLLTTIRTPKKRGKNKSSYSVPGKEADVAIVPSCENLESQRHKCITYLD